MPGIWLTIEDASCVQAVYMSELRDLVIET